MSPDSQQNDIDVFWSWFVDHEREFHHVADGSDPVLHEIINQLQRVDDHLWAEVCVNSSPRELIITAEGNTDLFPLVDRIVSGARPCEGWQFLALKPPMGFDFETNYEGHRFDPQTMWFLPLRSASDPSSLGIRVGVPDYDPSLKRQTHNAVLVILDTALGERRAALDIQHVDVAQRPNDPASAGYLELPTLLAYLDWRRDQQSTT